MSLFGRMSRAVLAPLLAFSTYIAPEISSPDDASIEAMRAQFGGQLSPPPRLKLRWYLRDLEDAQYKAANGDLSLAGALSSAMEADGVLRGTLATRTGGLVRLPKRFTPSASAPEFVEQLRAGGASARSEFDEMLPATELEAFMGDFVKLGVAIGELCEVEGRDFPVFVRRMPEFLIWRWTEQRWYFRSLGGMIPITPGDGQWVLLTAGREAPWMGGLWRALGRAYITKDHARNYRDTWESKLANAARVATAPLGSTEKQRQSWFQQVAAWGANTVFSLVPGWKVELIESNGRGHESFVETIKEQSQEIVVVISGQTVTTDGGVGFANADIFKSIKSDLIQRDGDALAHCVNTQVLPQWVVRKYGIERIAETPTVAWDTTPPLDQKAIADSLEAGSNAIERARDIAASFGKQVDFAALALKFGIPITGDLETVTAPKRLELAPTDLAKVVRAREARATLDLPPFGDDRDDQTVSQLGESAEASAKLTAQPFSSAEMPS